MLRLIHVARLHLLNPRIACSSSLVRLQEQRDFVHDLERGWNFGNGVETVIVPRRGLYADGPALGRRVGNECRGARGLQDMLTVQIVRIGIPGLVSRNDANANTNVDAFSRTLDDLFLKDDRMIDPVLKIEVGIVTAPGQTLSKIRFQISTRHVVLFEEDRIIHLALS